MTHYGVGQMVRDSIKEIGGTMPEDLPAADSIAKARKRLEKESKKLDHGSEDK